MTDERDGLLRETARGLLDAMEANRDGDIIRAAKALDRVLRRIREGVAGLPNLATDDRGALIDRAAVLLLIDTEIGAGEPG